MLTEIGDKRVSTKLLQEWVKYAGAVSWTGEPLTPAQIAGLSALGALGVGEAVEADRPVTVTRPVTGADRPHHHRHFISRLFDGLVTQLLGAGCDVVWVKVLLGAGLHVDPAMTLQKAVECSRMCRAILIDDTIEVPVDASFDAIVELHELTFAFLTSLLHDGSVDAVVCNVNMYGKFPNPANLVANLMGASALLGLSHG